MREERIPLEHRVQRTEVGRSPGYVGTFHQDIPFVGCQESGDEAEHGGLPAAGGSEKGEEFALVYIQINVIQHFNVGKVLVKMTDLDNLFCHFVIFSTW